MKGSQVPEPVTNRLSYDGDDDRARFRFDLKLLRKRKQTHSKRESN